MSNRVKIIIGVVAFVMLGIVGIAVTQGIRYAHLNNELKKQNENHLQRIEILRQEKIKEASAHDDTLKYWMSKALESKDSVKIIEQRIKTIEDESDNIILPNDPDGRIRELENISAEYGIHR